MIEHLPNSVRFWVQSLDHKTKQTIPAKQKRWGKVGLRDYKDTVTEGIGKPFKKKQASTVLCCGLYKLKYRNSNNNKHLDNNCVPGIILCDLFM